LSRKSLREVILLTAPQTALRVADLERSLRFYLSLPAFALVERDRATARLTGPGGVTLLLAAPSADLSPWPRVPEAGPGAWVYLHRADLPGLAVELAERGMPGHTPEEPYPGWRQLLLPDPDGYLLAFWESLPLSDEQVLALYRTGPDRLEAALKGLDDLDLERAPGKWTIRQIVHHLVDADLSTFQVIRMALALPGRQITSDLWNPDDWMTGLRCDERPVGPAVALFRAARAWVLEAAAHLEDALDRSVSWPSGYSATVRDLLRQVGGHALHHILQIEETRRRHGR
jgi:catechol 2,3-dioxygenase-like lactoylglutathione lyase family enzyme